MSSTSRFWMRKDWRWSAETRSGCSWLSSRRWSSDCRLRRSGFLRSNKYNRQSRRRPEHCERQGNALSRRKNTLPIKWVNSSKDVKMKSWRLRGRVSLNSKKWRRCFHRTSSWSNYESRRSWTSKLRLSSDALRLKLKNNVLLKDGELKSKKRRSTANVFSSKTKKDCLKRRRDMSGLEVKKRRN